MQDKKVNAIVVYKQDRLSRSMADFWNMYGIFQESKIEFLSTTEKFAQGPQSILNLGISSTFAMYYSAELSQNVRRGHAQKVKNGWFPNTAPIGYENYGEKPKRYIRPHKTDAKLVKQAFELFASGDYSITDLTEVMSKKGMQTQRGSSIARSSISRMLKNPIYYGDFLWKGVVYEGKHKPIITKDLFDKVQSILEFRRVKGTRDRKHNFMLRGHVYCTCGSRLVGELTTKTYKNGIKQTFSYFGCKSRKKNRTCSGKYIKMATLEEKVADLFKNLQFTDDFKKDVIQEAKSIIEEVRTTETNEEKLIKQCITKTQTRMKNAEDDRFDRLISRDEFADIYNRLKAELAEATQELAKLQGDHSKSVEALESVLSLTENIHESYLRADANIKRKYLKTFFEKIIVDDGKIVEVVYNPIISDLLEIREVRISGNWRDVVNEVRTSLKSKLLSYC